MPLLPAATPCPPGFGSSCDNFVALDPREDTIATQDIDFTTEFQPHQFRSAAPRRPARLGAAARRPAAATFAVHEGPDSRPNRSSPVKASTNNGGGRFGTILSQPAQRIKPTQKIPADTQHPAANKAESRRRSRRSSILPDHAAGESTSSSPLKHHNDRRRRGTVYIPSEDTTIPKVHLGIFSPIKSEAEIRAESEALSRIEAQIVKKQGPKKKSLAAAPKRGLVPLQPSLQPIQEAVFDRDVYSGHSGKENLPPNMKMNWDSEGKFGDKPKCSTKIANRSSAKHPRPLALGLITAASSNAEIRDDRDKRKVADMPKGGQSAVELISHSSPGESIKFSNSAKPGAKKGRAIKKAPRAQTSPVTRRDCEAALTLPPKAPAPTIARHYPLISHEVQYCNLYEENWLEHQETTLTQLINHVFGNMYDKTLHSLSLSDELTHTLLGIYQTPFFSNLFERLKASLECGALAMSKQSMAAVRLDKDVGQHSKFLGLFLDTYNVDALKVAAEVVAGRKCFPDIWPSTSTFNAQNKAICPTSGKVDCRDRLLEKFLNHFFVHDDGTSLEECGQIHTPLRSLMLILLLDRAKDTGGVFRGALFKPTSPHKSSLDVLRTLKNVLLPSLGDISRPLSQMGYELSHQQTPLDEYEFRVRNLATDLRDGVCLARLVDTLGISQRTCENDSHDRHAEVPCKFDDTSLTNKLKIPAHSKTLKLFNVQLSLDTLSRTESIVDIVQGIRAEDIVNGHREKTLALLWAVLGKYGLPSLVDNEDIIWEIGRLSRLAEHKNDLFVKLNDVKGPSEQCEVLLKEWASSVARLKGIWVDNLTTDFAGSEGYQVFEAIVDRYSLYLPRRTGGNRSGEGMGCLQNKLRSMGCSAEFAKVFKPKRDGMGGQYSFLFNRETTLAALTFLASRLLPVTKVTRSAIVIQRAWRSMIQQRSVHIDPLLGPA